MGEHTMLNWQRGSTSTLVLVGVLMLGMVGWGMYHLVRVSELEQELANTRSQLQQSTPDDSLQRNAVQGATDEVSGDENTSMVQSIEDPEVRLALFQAYTTALRDALDDDLKESLDVVVVYVETNPEVLELATPELPQDVAEAVASVQSAIKEEALAAASGKTADESKLDVGDEVEVMGTLEFVGDDGLTGSGIFRLTTAEGVALYFRFSAENTSTYRESLVGKEVSATLSITSIEEGVVQYDVVTGPTETAD